MLFYISKNLIKSDKDNFFVDYSSPKTQRFFCLYKMSEYEEVK